MAYLKGKGKYQEEYEDLRQTSFQHGRDDSLTEDDILIQTMDYIYRMHFYEKKDFQTALDERVDVGVELRKDDLEFLKSIQQEKNYDKMLDLTIKRILTRQNRKEKKVVPKVGVNDVPTKLTLDLISRLPSDSLRKIALGLKYEEILEWCRTATKFRDSICQDPRFWMLKIKKEYPEDYVEIPKEASEEEIEKIYGEAKTKYELLYAKTLEQKSSDIFHKGPLRDSRIQEIDKEIGDFEKEIDRLKSIVSKLDQESKIIVRRYRDEGTGLKRQADALRKKAQGIFPEKIEREYIEIRTIPEAIEDLKIELNDLGENDAFALQKYLINEGLVNIIELKEGNIIGVRDSFTSRDSLPGVLIFIYRENKNLKFAYEYFSPNGYRRMYKILENWISTDLISAYDFPFIQHGEELEEEVHQARRMRGGKRTSESDSDSE